MLYQNQRSSKTFVVKFFDWQMIAITPQKKSFWNILWKLVSAVLQGRCQVWNVDSRWRHNEFFLLINN